MRAGNMTVGIDLCNIEKLKIVNGYEVIKKEEQLSTPSSPEDNNCTDDQDGDNTQRKAQNSARNKCGRPSNPVPRHKRDSHIKAEYKRRDKIQKGFETLTSLVPELRGTSSVKESKSSLLFKTAEYIHRLKAECEAQSEAAALRHELETLGTMIHGLQDQLPENGLPVVEKPLHHMDTLYDEYLKAETKKNWKFWLFSFFIRPLYKSYRQVTYDNKTPLQFTQAVNTWLQETLTLANLRKGFFDTLRKISTQTSIMTSPEQLRHEAMSTFQEMTPIYVEPPQPPVSAKPLATATLLTPPLTPPNVTSDKPRSRGSRSRSSTPPSGDVKPRKRSGNRCEASCSSIEESNQAKKISIRNASVLVPHVTVAPHLSRPIVLPQQPAATHAASIFSTSVVPDQRAPSQSRVRAYTLPLNVTHSALPPQSAMSSTTSSPPTNLFPVAMTAMETEATMSGILSDMAHSTMVTSLVETLINVLPHAVVAPLATAAHGRSRYTAASPTGRPTTSPATRVNIPCSTLPASTQVLPSSTQIATTHTSLNGISDAANTHMDVQTSPPLQQIQSFQPFMPVEQSVDNGSIAFEQTPISDGSFDTPMLPDIPMLPVITSSAAAPFQSTDDFIDDLCAFSTTQTSTLPTFAQDTSCSNLTFDRIEKFQPFHISINEDSLEKMLSLDVTDIGSLMSFLNQDDASIDQTTNNGHS